MAKTVSFSDEIVAQVADVAPSYEFGKYAQAAVREKINRDREDRLLRRLVNAPGT